jgi:hypothetical protein
MTILAADGFFLGLPSLHRPCRASAASCA